MAEVLRFDNVGVTRGGEHLLSSMSWRVRAGERWVVLGPNGAGKTTALRVAAAQILPSSGQATVLGERLGACDVFELRPLIGMASAAIADDIPAHERVRDVVLTASHAVVGRAGENYESMDLRRAAEQMFFMGIETLVDRTYGSLSEGERKRTLLARAMMTDPELLLLDEPCAGLDLGAREDVLGRLARLAADSSAPTQVLVTHHVEEIPPGFTHALLLREGYVVAAGPIDQALTAQNLADTFAVGVTLEIGGGRYAARATRLPGIR